MLNEPRICYLLDGFLLLYGIIITALFFREKFGKSQASPQDPIDTGLGTETEQSIPLRPVNRPESSRVRSGTQPPQRRREDAEPRMERGKKKKEQVYQGLNEITMDNPYDALNRQPALPPR